MKDYDELIDELGSKIEQRARMQQQIDLLWQTLPYWM